MPLLSENSFQRLSDDIIGPAENLTLSILERIKKIARTLIGNPTQPISQEQIERELAEQWEVFFREAKNWTDQAMPNAYLRGIQKTNAQIPTGTEARFGVPPTIELAGAAGISGSGGDISATAKEILSDYPKHHSIYTAFQDAAYNKFSQTRLPVIRDTKGKVRDLIIQASEQSYRDADGFTRRKMSQDLMNKFADDNITGIQYRDGRTMKLDTYSEMIARSQTGNAARQASINRLQQHGLDLVQISQHFPTSDLCRPWQARVYSVSGTSDRYPPLSEATNGGLYHPNSLTKDSQVYTKQGWKLIKDITKEDKILSLNPDSHTPEWSGISELHQHESEKMVELKSNSFDLCVTLDHDLYIGYKGRQKGVKGRPTKYKFEKAIKAIERGFFAQLRCVNWEGNKKDVPVSGLTREQFAKILAWYISDGSLSGNTIYIAKSKEPHKTKLGKVLEPLGFNHDGRCFTITNSEWATYFKQFGVSYKKFLPEWIKNETREIINVFLEAYILGDGSSRTNNYKDHEFTEVEYFTTSKRLADDLGEVILKGGYYPSYKLQPNKGKIIELRDRRDSGNYDVWRISRNTIKESYYLNSPSNKHKGIDAEIIDYNDTAYCVTLEKNHIMWVRRNGKTTWSGNCKHFQSAYIPGASELPDEEMTATKNRKQYELEQTQRYNERQIRRWKRRKATALTDSELEKAKSKIRAYQKKNRELVDRHDFLRRKYTRESITATGRNNPTFPN